MSAVVKCRICGKECTSEEAGIHKMKTGHNSWDMILPKKE